MASTVMLVAPVAYPAELLTLTEGLADWAPLAVIGSETSLVASRKLPCTSSRLIPMSPVVLLVSKNRSFTPS